MPVYYYTKWALGFLSIYTLAIPGEGYGIFWRKGSLILF
jgi:hypothetical protein